VSLYDYNVSRQISRSDPPFAALIMAALRKANTDDAAWLWRSFPDICQEMQDRCNAPGGRLPGDPEHETMPDVEAMGTAERPPYNEVWLHRRRQR
jgi:hypothetical protein